MEPIVVAPGTAIPASALVFRTSRSGGPGGQHVNTSSTRVELVFDTACPVLGGWQRARIREQLANRIDQEGLLHVVCQTHRSQLQNRMAVVVRFRKLLQSALKPRKRRRATRPTLASRARRLDAKRKRGQRKQNRRPPDHDG